MDALLGAVLVAQFPSRPAEVILQYPSSEDGSLPSSATNSPKRGESSQALTSPSGGSGSLSCEDLLVKAGPAVYGIPASIFAKLALPDDQLVGQPLYLEMDAGAWQSDTPHDMFSHLHIVSFPCNVSDFSSSSAPGVASGTQARSDGATIPGGNGLDLVAPLERVTSLERVQRFNVVHVLDSRRTGRRENNTSTLWQVSAHLAHALVAEEMRVEYLSREIQKLQAGEMAGSSASPKDSDSFGLPTLLKDMFEGVRECGYKSLSVNGFVHCQVSVFSKHDAPAPPSADQALTLICSRETLLNELPIDCAEIVCSVIESALPTVSLGELSVRLGLPLRTVQRVSQHLVYWKKARVVDVFTKRTRLTVASGVDATANSALSRGFRSWMDGVQKGQGGKKSGRVTLSEVVIAFSGGSTMQTIADKLQIGVDFDKLLEWLVAEGLVVQLAKYYHFIPGRAEASRGMPSVNISQNIRKMLGAISISDEELRLLAGRVDTTHPHQLVFLCRFVVDFARAHRRADGRRFAAFARALMLGREAEQEAEELLDANDDILVPYTCRC